MRMLAFLCVLGLAIAVGLEDAHGQSLEDLAKVLEREGVGTQTYKGTATFVVVGRTATYWERSLAMRLAQHYQSDKKYVLAQIVCVWPANTSGLDRGWTAATRRAGTLAGTLQRHGVPAGQIQVHAMPRSDATGGGEVHITFLRERHYLKRVGDNLVEGVTDVVASPTELPKGVMETGQEEGAVAGGTKGTVRGFGSTLRRAGNGAVRILTFWAG